jgi:hypothetical protein
VVDTGGQRLHVQGRRNPQAGRVGTQEAVLRGRDDGVRDGGSGAGEHLLLEVVELGLFLGELLEQGGVGSGVSLGVDGRLQAADEAVLLLKLTLETVPVEVEHISSPQR